MSELGLGIGEKVPTINEKLPTPPDISLCCWSNQQHPRLQVTIYTHRYGIMLSVMLSVNPSVEIMTKCRFIEEIE